MKRVIIIVAVAALAAGAYSEWVFAGKWGSYGEGNGKFRLPFRVAVDRRHYDNVYVADWGNLDVQYFTRTGSFLGKWTPRSRVSIAFAPNGWRYQADFDNHRVEYFDENGSFLGSWGTEGPGEGEFNGPMGLDEAVPSVRIYVADTGNRRIQYFTSNGSFLAAWRVTRYPNDVASSLGNFHVAYKPYMGVAVEPFTDYVYLADTENHRIRYFTSNGSFLGQFGSYGAADGKFDRPSDVAFSGAFLYVADTGNCRIQYFKDIEFAVEPESLGKVKALFR